MGPARFHCATLLHATSRDFVALNSTQFATTTCLFISLERTSRRWALVQYTLTQRNSSFTMRVMWFYYFKMQLMTNLSYFLDFLGLCIAFNSPCWLDNCPRISLTFLLRIESLKTTKTNRLACKWCDRNQNTRQWGHTFVAGRQVGA